MTAHPDAKVLTPAEVLEMVTADRDLQLARLTKERDQFRLALERERAEAALQRGVQELVVRSAEVTAAEQAHKRVVAEIEARYAVDLRQWCFDPRTGELEPAPKEAL